MYSHGQELTYKSVKAFKMRRFKGCYKWDLTLLNLAPFLFVLITSEPMINIETSISANHNLLLLGKKRQIQKGQVSFIASLKMSHFLNFISFPKFWPFSRSENSSFWLVFGGKFSFFMRLRISKFSKFFT